MKLFAFVFVLFAVLLSLACAEEVTPSSVNVFFSPNGPLPEGANNDGTVLYIRISGPKVDGTETYTKVAYHKKFEAALSLPPTVKGAAGKDYRCEIGSNEHVLTVVYTNTGAEEPDTLKVSLELEKVMEVDHLRIFCYNLPSATGTFPTHTSQIPATVSYFQTSSAAAIHQVDVGTTYHEIVEEPYTRHILMTYTLDKPGVSTANVNKAIDGAKGIFGFLGLDINLYSVVPNEKTTDVTFELFSHVDHDIIESSMQEAEDTSYIINVISYGGKASNLRFSTTTTPLKCEVEVDGEKPCGGECFRCEEQSPCTSMDECKYSFCSEEGKCENPNSGALATVTFALIIALVALLF